MPLFLLTLDQGGHASRATLFDQTHQIVAKSSVNIETQHPYPGWVEHDPDAMILSLQSAIQRTLKQVKLPKHAQIIAGIACQRASMVCWHRPSGRTFSNIISWQDRRASNITEHPLASIPQLTGLRISPHYGAGKMRWCLDHILALQHIPPTELALAPLMSYLLSMLVEPQAYGVDPINAARTLLFNLHHNTWSNTLCEHFGISRTVLPNIHPCTHAWGNLKQEGRTIPLQLAMGDQSAALFCRGQPDDQALYINIGTGAFIQKIITNLPHDPSPLLSSLAYSNAATQTYVLEGTVNGAGSAIEWFLKQYPIDHFFTQLTHWLNDTALIPGWFFNGISGLGSPYWVSDFNSHFEQSNTLAEKAVALIESILFLLQRNIEIILANSNDVNKIILSGGLTQQPALRQRLADLSCLPVHCYPEIEATSQGMAQLLNPQPSLDKPTILTPQENLKLQQRYTYWRQKMDSWASYT